MAMLECYEPSPIAWDVLKRVADAFMDVPDETAVEAMNRLARPPAGDRAIVAGESGAAGCAGLLTVLRDPGMSRSIGLGPASRVLLVNTEGATDPGRYRELTGLDPSQVAARPIG